MLQGSKMGSLDQPPGTLVRDIAVQALSETSAEPRNPCSQEPSCHLKTGV